MLNLSWNRTVEALPVSALGDGLPCHSRLSLGVLELWGGSQAAALWAGDCDAGASPGFASLETTGNCSRKDRPWLLFTFLFCICGVPNSAPWFAFSPESFGIHASIQLRSSLPSCPLSPSLVHVHGQCWLLGTSQPSRGPRLHPHTSAGRAAVSSLPFVGSDGLRALVQEPEEAFALDFEMPRE